MKKAFLLAIGIMFTSSAFAAIKTETVEYKEGDTTLEGFVAYDDTILTKRPVVLIVHQWKGLSDYEKKRAEMLAKLGYVAFAVDIYGKGVRPKEVSEASKMAGKFKNDRELLRKRVRAGLDQARKHQRADSSNVAAIGYC